MENNLDIIEGVKIVGVDTVERRMDTTDLVRYTHVQNVMKRMVNISIGVPISNGGASKSRQEPLPGVWPQTGL